MALFLTWSIQETSRAGLSFNKPLAECLDVAAKQVFTETPKDQLKILDAGAGTGLTGVELYKLGYTNIEALDISQEMLNVAEKKGVYKRFVCTPLTEQRIAEFGTGEFDALISAGVLVKAHVRPAAFVEMIRMVKTGESYLSFILFFGGRSGIIWILIFMIPAVFASMIHDSYKNFLPDSLFAKTIDYLLI